MEVKKLTDFGIKILKEHEKQKGRIPPGKIRCFIKSVLRNDKPEERVRQEVARSLVEEYGYRKEDIEIESPIRVGRNIKRADIVVFYENSDDVRKSGSVENLRNNLKALERPQEIGEAGELIGEILIPVPPQSIQEKIGRINVEAYEKKDEANVLEMEIIKKLEAELEELAK